MDRRMRVLLFQPALPKPNSSPLFCWPPSLLSRLVVHGRTPRKLSQTTFSTQQQLEWSHGTWLRQLLTGPSLGFVSAKEGAAQPSTSRRWESPLWMLALEAPAHFFHVLKVVEGFVYVIDLCLYMNDLETTWKSYWHVRWFLSILSHLNARPRSRLWRGLSTVKISSEGESARTAFRTWGPVTPQEQSQKRTSTQCCLTKN